MIIASEGLGMSPASTQIKGDEGKLRRLINLYVIDEDIRLPGGKTDAFQDGDEITLIPPLPVAIVSRKSS